MSLGRQLLLTLLLLVGLGGGSYWYYRDIVHQGSADAAVPETERPVPVALAPASVTVLTRSVEAVGTTRANQSIDVVALSAGRVVEVAFEPGSRVERGDVLVRLDASSERASLAEAEAEQHESQLALDRALQLRANNTVAQATVDQLQAANDATLARVELVRKALDDRVITAPFDGVVGLRQVDIGARVGDSTVLTTLDDLAEIEIDFSVPETFYGALARGQKVTATSAAFAERAFEGTVRTIDSRVDPVSRAFHVRAILPNPDLTLPAGMFMRVELILDEREALTIPEEAVTTSGGQSFVFVVEDTRAARRTVTLGQRTYGRVEVTDGLAAGEQVVTSGLQRLRDGSSVQLPEAEPAPPSAATPAQELAHR